MIFVSSSCVRYKKICDSVSALAENGFMNIELSGGTQFYGAYLEDLLCLKEKYNLTYRCHNYFPPPEKHFVLNLASLDDNIYVSSLEHLKKSIDVSVLLGADKFGFHAGFYVDINTEEIGRSVSKKEQYDKAEAQKRFYEAVRVLNNYADGVTLYVENNVTSAINLRTHGGNNPFMLTCSAEYRELASVADIKLLLDIAHLKVSCRSLGLDFAKELAELASHTDYVHISDNDGLNDQNLGISGESQVHSLLKKSCKADCDFTLEIYSGISDLISCYNLIDGMKND